MEYKNKYLKYKNKYIKLRNINLLNNYGGNNDILNLVNILNK